MQVLKPGQFICTGIYGDLHKDINKVLDKHAYKGFVTNWYILLRELSDLMSYR